MAYDAKNINDEPSQLLLENGLVVSFRVRYDHRKVFLTLNIQLPDKKFSWLSVKNLITKG